MYTSILFKKKYFELEFGASGSTNEEKAVTCTIPCSIYLNNFMLLFIEDMHD